MAGKKSGTVFFCQECGYESAKWLGQCPGCRAWNSFVEEPVKVSASGKRVTTGLREDSTPLPISKIDLKEEDKDCVITFDFFFRYGRDSYNITYPFIDFGEANIPQADYLLSLFK